MHRERGTTIEDATSGFPAADHPKAAAPQSTLVLEAPKGWHLVDLRELYERRDLLTYMTLRGIKARYAQSVLGFGWAIFQPIVTMLVYTVIFSRVADISMPGNLPYSLIAFCGIVPWMFFSGALTASSSSLIVNNAMISKIYFPRVIIPLSEILARLVDLGIMLVLMAGLIAFYAAMGHEVAPRPEAVVVVPLMLLVAFMAALGLGLWLSAMAVQYRDVAYAMSFVIQLMMYLTPVIYATEMIPRKLQPIFALNPMVGVISGIRASVLGPPYSYHLPLILEGTAIAVALLVSGLFYFRRSERLFADVA